VNGDWLLAVAEWCEASWLGETVGDSIWAFPVIEATHLLGLSLLGGALLVVDLRMLGFGLTRQTISELARAARRWLALGLAIMVATGVPLFMSEAVKCYYNTSFWVKLTALVIALLYTALIRAPIARGAGLDTSIRIRVTALGSIALWFTVAAAGRWIGFSS